MSMKPHIILATSCCLAILYSDNIIIIMFRKPKKKPSALRTSGGSGATTSTTSSGAKRANKKRPRQTRDSSSSDEDNNDNDNDDDDGANNTSDLLQQIRQERSNIDNKKIKSKTLLNTSGTTKHKKSRGMMHQYKSSNVQLSAKEMATRTAEYHPANDSKHDSNSKDNDDNDNSDKAQNAALPSLQKAAHNPFHAGPLKATTFVRTTARFDYQPDICKDYKETGFCGFGDTCIYLHDRGDTKSGWQMEQEYEEKKRGEEERKGREMERFMNSMMCGEVSSGGGGGVKKKKSGDDDYFGNNKEDDAKNANDGIPYACHICRGPFQNPVVTTCGHYYCESCMQTRIRESGLTTCPICQKDTHGVLNHAQKLVAKKRRLVGRDGSWEDYLAKK